MDSLRRARIANPPKRGAPSRTTSLVLLWWALALLLPVSLHAQELVACAYPDREIDSDFGPPYEILDVLEPEILTTPWLSLALTTPEVESWEFELTSPAGTTIRLKRPLPSAATLQFAGTDFDVIFSDSGTPVIRLPNTASGGSSVYDCGGCLIQPWPGGAFEDFAGEIAFGEWELRWRQPNQSRLVEWCLLDYAVRAVTDVGASHRIDTDGDGMLDAPGAPGVFSVFGVAPVEYDDVIVRVGDKLLYTIPGPFAAGDLIYGDNSLYPVDPFQRVEAELVGRFAGQESGPVAVAVVLSGEPIAEASISLGPAIISGDEEFDLEFDADLADTVIGDIQVHVTLVGFPRDLEIRLRSPSGTSVTLCQGLETGDQHLVFWDYGLEHEARSNPLELVGLDRCACVIRPSGPGALRDFIGETIGGQTGSLPPTSLPPTSLPPTWEIGATDKVSANTAGLIELAIQILEETPPYPPQLDACEVGSEVGSVDLSWTNGAEYTGLQILVDGELWLEDDGSLFDLDANVSNVATLEGISVPRRARVQVRGIGSGETLGPPAECRIALRLPPVEELWCRSASGSDSLEASWVNGADYDKIDVYMNGDLAASVAGDRTRVQLAGPFPYDTPLEVHVVPRVLGGAPSLDYEARATTCRTLALQLPDIEVCSGFFFEPDGVESLSLVVDELATIEKVELFQQMRTPLRPETNIELVSPAGTTWQIYPSTLHSSLAWRLRPNQLVLWDSDAADTFNVGRLWEGLRMKPSNYSFRQPLGFQVFEGEPAAGEWILRSAAPTRFESGEFCIRFDACPTIAPQLLAVLPDPSDAMSVILEWEEPREYDAVTVLRNGEEIAQLDAGVGSYTDSVSRSGYYGYEIVGTDPTELCEARSNFVSVQLGGTQNCVGPVELGGAVDWVNIPALSPVQVESVDLSIDLLTSVAPRWLELESPAGTLVRLWTGSRFIVDGRLDLYYSEVGLPLPDWPPFSTEPPYLPPGPGTFGDFRSEVADGTWRLWYDTPPNSSPRLEEACLVVYEGCSAPPPSGISGERLGDDAVWTWDNNGDYDAIEIELNGEIVANLAGDSTSYSALDVAVGEHCIRVLATADDCTSFSGISDPLLIGVDRFCETFTTPQVIGDSDDGSIEVLLGPPYVEAVHVQVDLRHVALDRLELYLTNPVGTSVGLQMPEDDAGQYWEVAYSDREDVVFGTLPIFPPDNALIPLSLLVSPTEMLFTDGEWELEITDDSTSFQTGALDSWCLYLETGCAIPKPTSLSCADTNNDYPVVLDWENTGIYDEIDILRDGVLIATIDGAEESFSDDTIVLPPGTTHIYEVHARREDESCSSAALPCRQTVGTDVVCAEPSSTFDDSIPIDGPDVSDTFLISEISVFVDMTAAASDTSVMQAEIVSPSGTTRVLLNTALGPFTRARIWFDDDGQSVIYLPGYLQEGGGVDEFQPAQALAAFEGEDPVGEWIVQTDSSSTTLHEACVEILATPSDATLFLRGDVNSSGTLDLLDPLLLLAHVFGDDPEPPCLKAGDFDGDGTLNALTDSLSNLQWQFSDGASPPAPFPECGYDNFDVSCSEPPECD